MSDVFWLSDAQTARLEAYFPKSHGKPRVDDRRILNGIIFINCNGLRRRYAPKVYGLHKTLHNSWKRWSDKDIFGQMVAKFAYRIANGNIWPRRKDGEFSLASVTRVIRDNFTSRFTPLEVHFEHPAPEDPQPLERMFRAPVRYLQPVNRLIIARPEALRAIRHEDRGLLATRERHVLDLIGEATPVVNTTSAARAVIGAHLGLSAITLDRVAAALHLDEVRLPVPPGSSRSPPLGSGWSLRPSNTPIRLRSGGHGAAGPEKPHRNAPQLTQNGAYSRSISRADIILPAPSLNRTHDFDDERPEAPENRLTFLPGQLGQFRFFGCSRTPHPAHRHRYPALTCHDEPL